MSSSPSKHLADSRTITAIILAVILAAGAYFRLARLGDTALRADEIGFWRICQVEMPAGQIVSRWLDLMGNSGQFPFPNAFAKWFVDINGLELNHFTARLPSALWGILAVLAAFGLGRQLAGDRAGLILAALLAFNPYHIQTVREAYFYPPMLLGAFLMVWAAVWIIQCGIGSAVTRPLFAMVATAGMFLCLFSQPAGLSIAIMAFLVVLGGMAWCYRRDRKLPRHQIVSLTLCVLLLLAAFSVPWGIPQLRANVSGTVKEAAVKATAIDTTTIWDLLWNALTTCGWGKTGPRAAISVLLLAFGLAVIVREARRRKDWLLLPLLIVCGTALFAIAQHMGSLGFGTRYVSPLLPVFLAIVALGIEGVPSLGSSVWPSAARRESILRGVLLALALLSWLPAAWLSTRLEGLPTPYKRAIQLVEQTVPKGTPVLVDRWFEPWNELAVHGFTNAVFTFTVPNEPYETFVNVNWRDTAASFLQQNRDAAYLEIVKSYAAYPDVGHWAWPYRFFARHVGITNSAGLRLRQMGLAAREDFYLSDTNRVVVNFFYNTREDVLAQARRNGEPVVVFYGSGWQYTKTQDYRDWRAMGRSAELELYNLSNEALDAEIVLAAVAPQSAKRVTWGRAFEQEFPANQPAEWRIGPVRLEPGRQLVLMEDTLGEHAQAALLVAGISVTVQGAGNAQ